MRVLLLSLFFIASVQAASQKPFNCNNLEFAKKRLSISSKNYLNKKKTNKDKMRASLAANIIRSYATNEKCGTRILLLEGNEMFLINYPNDKKISTDRLIFSDAGTLELWERVARGGIRQKVRF